MGHQLLSFLLCTAPLFILAAVAAAAEDRTKIPPKYRWDLTHLFASPAAWREAREAIEARIPAFARHEGHLGDSASALLAGLAAVMDTDRDLHRLLSYASQLHDEDTRVSLSLEMLQEAEQLAVRFQSATSFVAPEILALDEAVVRGFLESEPALAPYRPFLDDILRRKPHTLTPSEERIVAEAGNLANAGDALHSIFTNADFPYPEITLTDGTTVRLDAAAYGEFRAAPDRRDRVAVFTAFWTAYQQYRRTMASSLYAQVKAHLFEKTVHRFDSALDAALFTYNIPTSVYRQLVADVNANLGTLHRYLDLRRRILGLDRLGYEDLYVPLVQQKDLQYSPEEGMDLVARAVAPLGEEYAAVLRGSIESGWTDFLPSPGKRSGAYSNSTYGVHPYQLLNFMGRFDDVSTLAHELGHSMHSWLADRAQPYVTHDYSIFVAEVASTLNENLLLHTMLEGATDDATRLFLLGHHLDGLRATLFRQTLFAEFELAIHEMAERGESLTGDNLNELYLGLARRYYGHDRGVCHVEELYAAEWAYIPHFYWNFYVYQYATSVVASTAIANAIRAERPGHAARDRYLAMLAAGSSKYPIELLRDAGVDMTTSRPFDEAMREMNAVMDSIEEILARRS